MRLIDRDEWIGWTHRQRAERLGLVVQNRRFLVLAETRMPNLASRAMGLALRHLPEQWEQKHGYRPLLAETFTDIEAFEGTCYKASNWEPCGLTKGFERRHRADFYREHKRPRKLWLKALARNTRVILAGMDMPAAYQPGCKLRSAERALPLKKVQIESLREALRNVPDPRADNRSWPLSTLLGLVCLGLFAGRKNLAAVHRYGQFLTRQQRVWLGFPPKPGGRPGRRAPSYKALYNLLGSWTPTTWPTRSAAGWPPTTAPCRARWPSTANTSATLCSPSRSASMTPERPSPSPSPPKNLKARRPKPRARSPPPNGSTRRSISTTPWSPGTPCTASAGTCTWWSGTAATSSSRSKEDQPTAMTEAGASPRRRPPFACETKDRGHGRIEHRRVEVFPIEPLACGLPHARSLVVVTKRAVHKPRCRRKAR